MPPPSKAEKKLVVLKQQLDFEPLPALRREALRQVVTFVKSVVSVEGIRIIEAAEKILWPIIRQPNTVELSVEEKLKTPEAVSPALDALLELAQLRHQVIHNASTADDGRAANLTFLELLVGVIKESDVLAADDFLVSRPAEIDDKRLAHLTAAYRWIGTKSFLFLYGNSMDQNAPHRRIKQRISTGFTLAHALSVLCAGWVPEEPIVSLLEGALQNAMSGSSHLRRRQSLEVVASIVRASILQNLSRAPVLIFAIFARTADAEILHILLKCLVSLRCSGPSVVGALTRSVAGRKVSDDVILQVLGFIMNAVFDHSLRGAACWVCLKGWYDTVLDKSIDSRLTTVYILHTSVVLSFLGITFTGGEDDALLLLVSMKTCVQWLEEFAAEGAAKCSSDELVEAIAAATMLLHSLLAINDSPESLPVVSSLENFIAKHFHMATLKTKTEAQSDRCRTWPQQYFYAHPVAMAHGLAAAGLIYGIMESKRAHLMHKIYTLSAQSCQPGPTSSALRLLLSTSVLRLYPSAYLQHERANSNLCCHGRDHTALCVALVVTLRMLARDASFKGGSRQLSRFLPAVSALLFPDASSTSAGFRVCPEIEFAALNFLGTLGGEKLLIPALHKTIMQFHDSGCTSYQKIVSRKAASLMTLATLVSTGEFPSSKLLPLLQFSQHDPFELRAAKVGAAYSIAGSYADAVIELVPSLQQAFSDSSSLIRAAVVGLFRRLCNGDAMDWGETWAILKREPLVRLFTSENVSESAIGTRFVADLMRQHACPLLQELLGQEDSNGWLTSPLLHETLSITDFALQVIEQHLQVLQNIRDPNYRFPSADSDVLDQQFIQLIGLQFAGTLSTAEAAASEISDALCELMSSLGCVVRLFQLLENAFSSSEVGRRNGLPLPVAFRGNHQLIHEFSFASPYTYTTAANLLQGDLGKSCSIRQGNSSWTSAEFHLSLTHSVVAYGTTTAESSSGSSFPISRISDGCARFLAYALRINRDNLGRRRHLAGELAAGFYPTLSLLARPLQPFLKNSGEKSTVLSTKLAALLRICTSVGDGSLWAGKAAEMNSFLRATAFDAVIPMYFLSTDFTFYFWKKFIQSLLGETEQSPPNSASSDSTAALLLQNLHLDPFLRDVLEPLVILKDNAIGDFPVTAAGTPDIFRNIVDATAAIALRPRLSTLARTVLSDFFLCLILQANEETRHLSRIRPGSNHLVQSTLEAVHRKSTNVTGTGLEKAGFDQYLPVSTPVAATCFRVLSALQVKNNNGRFALFCVSICSALLLRGSCLGEKNPLGSADLVVGTLLQHFHETAYSFKPNFCTDGVPNLPVQWFGFAARALSGIAAADLVVFSDVVRLQGITFSSLIRSGNSFGESYGPIYDKDKSPHTAAVAEAALGLLDSLSAGLVTYPTETNVDVAIELSNCIAEVLIADLPDAQNSVAHLTGIGACVYVLSECIVVRESRLLDEEARLQRMSNLLSTVITAATSGALGVTLPFLAELVILLAIFISCPAVRVFDESLQKVKVQFKQLRALVTVHTALDVSNAGPVAPAYWAATLTDLVWTKQSAALVMAGCHEAIFGFNDEILRCFGFPNTTSLLAYAELVLQGTEILIAPQAAAKTPEIAQTDGLLHLLLQLGIFHQEDIDMSAKQKVRLNFSPYLLATSSSPHLQVGILTIGAILHTLKAGARSNTAVAYDELVSHKSGTNLLSLILTQISGFIRLEQGALNVGAIVNKGLEYLRLNNGEEGSPWNMPNDTAPIARGLHRAHVWLECVSTLWRSILYVEPIQQDLNLSPVIALQQHSVENVMNLLTATTVEAMNSTAAMNWNADKVTIFHSLRGVQQSAAGLQLTLQRVVEVLGAREARCSQLFIRELLMSACRPVRLKLKDERRCSDCRDVTSSSEAYSLLLREIERSRRNKRFLAISQLSAAFFQHPGRAFTDLLQILLPPRRKLQDQFKNSSNNETANEREWETALIILQMAFLCSEVLRCKDSAVAKKMLPLPSSDAVLLGFEEFRDAVNFGGISSAERSLQNTTETSLALNTALATLKQIVENVIPAALYTRKEFARSKPVCFATDIPASVRLSAARLVAVYSALSKTENERIEFVQTLPLTLMQPFLHYPSVANFFAISLLSGQHECNEKDEAAAALRGALGMSQTKHNMTAAFQHLIKAASGENDNALYEVLVTSLNSAAFPYLREHIPVVSGPTQSNVVAASHRWNNLRCSRLGSVSESPFLTSDALLHSEYAAFELARRVDSAEAFLSSSAPLVLPWNQFIPLMGSDNDKCATMKLSSGIWFRTFGYVIVPLPTSLRSHAWEIGSGKDPGKSFEVEKIPQCYDNVEMALMSTQFDETTRLLLQKKQLVCLSLALDEERSRFGELEEAELKLLSDITGVDDAGEVESLDKWIAPFSAETIFSFGSWDNVCQHMTQLIDRHAQIL